MMAKRHLIVLCLLAQAVAFFGLVYPAQASPDRLVQQIKSYVCGIGRSDDASHGARAGVNLAQNVPEMSMFNGAGHAAHDMKGDTMAMDHTSHGASKICPMMAGPNKRLGGCCLKSGCDGTTQNDNGFAASVFHLLIGKEDAIAAEHLAYAIPAGNGDSIFKPSTPDPRPPRF